MKFTPIFIRAFILGCLASGESKSLADLVHDFEKTFSESLTSDTGNKLTSHNLGRNQLIFSQLIYLIRKGFLEVSMNEGNFIETTHFVDLYQMVFDGG